MKQCHYCNWSNTNLITIKVNGEARWICGGCTQKLANVVNLASPMELMERIESIEERLCKLEGVVVP